MTGEINKIRRGTKKSGFAIWQKNNCFVADEQPQLAGFWAETPHYAQIKTFPTRAAAEAFIADKGINELRTNYAQVIEL